MMVKARRAVGRGGWITLVLALAVLGLGYVSMAGVPRAVSEEDREALLTATELGEILNGQGAGTHALREEAGFAARHDRFLGPDTLSYSYDDGTAVYAMSLWFCASADEANERRLAHQESLGQGLGYGAEPCEEALPMENTSVTCLVARSGESMAIRALAQRDRVVLVLSGSGLPLGDVSSLHGAMNRALDHDLGE